MPVEGREEPQGPKSACWVNDGWEHFDEKDEAGVPQPYPPKSDSWRRNDTSIFVSISSFRDFRCPKTLSNLFTKSINPNRIYIGVVQQNNAGDPDCLYDYCKLIKQERNIQPIVTEDGYAAKDRILKNCPHASQVSMMRVSASNAKGPTYGRYLGSKLLGAQEFCMQTDSHMDFENHWDKRLLDMWGLANNEYGVLTTYVPHFDQMHININGRYEIPQVCRSFFTEPSDMVRNEQASNCIWLTKPKLTTTWAAGFAFNKCHADRKVPYDPHLPSVFDGEEYSKYARLWTRGYDTYAPHRSIVFHDYTHNGQTKSAESWSRQHRELQRSHERMRSLLGYPHAKVKRNSSEATAMLGRWDLGTKRTLSQLIEYTGIDTINHKVDFNSCGKQQWVPFDEEDEEARLQAEQEARARTIAGQMEDIPTGLHRIGRMLEADARQAVELARPWIGRSEGAAQSLEGRLASAGYMLLFFVLICSCLIAKPLHKARGRKAVFLPGLIPDDVKII